MTSIKYTPLPFEDKDEHVIEMAKSDLFDFSSTFDFGIKDSKSMFKSAFKYSNWNPNLSNAVEIESAPSLVGQICSPILTGLSYILVFLTLPISAWFSFKLVRQYERLVVYRLGKLHSMKGPGLGFVLPCIDSSTRVDIRTRAFSVPPQKVLTSDGATIELGSDMYFQVQDPVKSVSCVKDMDQSTRVLGQTTVQKILGNYTLPQVMGDRISIGRALQEEVNKTTLDWGVDITKVEMSPVKIIQEANPLLEGCNLASAPLNWLGPMLFPPGTTQLPVQPLQDRGLLPQDVVAARQLGQLGQILAPALMNMAGSPNVAPAPVARPRILPGDLLATIQPHLSAELVKQIGATFVFDVQGDDGGIYYIDLKNGEGRVGEGSLPDGEPDVTLILNVADLGQLFYGQMTAFQAYVSGRLKITGDMHAAMTLQDIIAKVKGSRPQ